MRLLMSCWDIGGGDDKGGVVGVGVEVRVGD